MLLLLVQMIDRIVLADEEALPEVTIADPFIDLHTGPGAGYPIFHIVDRGARVGIIRQRINWLQVRSASGEIGWASRDQMRQTLLPDGEKLSLKEADKSDYYRRSWLFGATGGIFDDAPILSLFSGYSFTENLSGELTYSESVGNVSSSNLVKLNIMIEPFAKAAYSPFFSLGMGVIRVKPSATLVVSNLRTNSFGQVGAGFHHYLSRRFVFRFEYSESIIRSASNDNDSNEEISEWKTGFVVFF